MQNSMTYKYKSCTDAISNLQPSLDAPLTLNVEKNISFQQGFAQIRRYHWEQQMLSEVTVPDDVLVLNMALTPRPRETRLAHPQLLGPDLVIEAGRLLIMMPGSHCRLFVPNGELLALNCTFELRKIEQLLGLTMTPASHANVIEPAGSHSGIEWLMNRMLAELMQQRTGWEVAIDAYASALCVELARNLREVTAQRTHTYTGGLAPWRMNIIAKRVAEDKPAPTLDELAELCAMTVRHLGRAFKEETGQTLGSFIRAATMERASRLLQEGNTSITQIATVLGFSSTASFHQAFKRETGETPGHYRERTQKLQRPVAKHQH